MHPDDLKTIWLCRECGRGFTFNSDVGEHKQQFKHSKMMLCDLQTLSQEMLPLFTRGRMSLDFRFSGKESRIIVEYEYYPSSGEINYVDVRYTDSRFKSMVEGDPDMMKSIDNYLRRLLTRKLSVRP
jgi:hypothetical protein